MSKTTVGELVYKISGDIDELKASVQKSEVELNKLKKGFDETEKAVKKTTNSGNILKNTVASIAGLFAVGSIVNFLKGAVQAAEDTIFLQTRLAQTIRQSTNATDEQIKSLFDQAEALEKVGVVSKEAILSAQGQLAAFNLTTESIQKLTPVMLDYIVAEQGINPSAEAAKNTANGFGKALQGQFDALTKSGNKLSESQKKLLTFGTETEKVTAIVDYFNENYENLNQTIGSSFPGQILHAQQAIGDIKEAIGFAFIPVINQLIGNVIDTTNNVDTSAVTINKWAKVIYQSINFVIAMGKALLLAIKALVFLGDTLVSVARVQFSFYKDIFNSFKNIGEIVGNVAKGIAQAFKGDFTAASETLKKTVKDTFSNTIASLDGMANRTAGWVQEMKDSFDDVGKSAVRAIDAEGFKPVTAAAITAYKTMQDKSKEAADTVKDKSKATADDIKNLKDRFEDLGQKGSDALIELEATTNDKLKNITDKIDDLKKSLVELNAEFDKGQKDNATSIGERIVAEQQALADLQKQIREEQSQEKPDSKRISELQAEFDKRNAALAASADLQKQFSTEIAEAQRRAALTDFQRDIEDFLKKRELAKQEFEAKKKEIEDTIKLQEDEKTKIIELYEAKQAEINAIITQANAQFQAFSNERVAITKKEVNEQIKSYNDLAAAIARAKSAQTTQLLQNKPQFAVGGFVDGRGGEVHPGEYVIPANLVQQFGSLIKVLEGARTGQVNNSRTINAPISIQAQVEGNSDWSSIARELQWELSRR